MSPIGEIAETAVVLSFTVEQLTTIAIVLASAIVTIWQVRRARFERRDLEWADTVRRLSADWLHLLANVHNARKMAGQGNPYNLNDAELGKLELD